MDLTLSRVNRKNHRIRYKQTNSTYSQGWFTPDNAGKYLGDVKNIVFRSSWELHVFEFCDDNKHILKWSSEEIAIPYKKPTFKKVPFKPAKYYPDLYVEYVSTGGAIIRQMIEIKPNKQTKPSRARKTKNRLYENAVYIINQSKWEAARQWCRARNIRFTIMSENDIFK